MIGYFLVADLLGFRSIIRNSDEQGLEIRISGWVELVESAARRCGLVKFQLISDTVFAAAESSAEGLKLLASFARTLLNEGTPQNLPVRGGICHGEYTWGERLTYGKAVVDAHELEMSQNWVGVACAPGVPHVRTLLGAGSLITYAVPMKGQLMQLCPAVDWNVPRAPVLAGNLVAGGLTHAGEHLPWAFGEKLANTLQFSVYKTLAARNGWPLDNFHGYTAMDAIELALLR